LIVIVTGQALALEMGSERVVLVELAEARLRASERMRCDGGSLTTWVDAALGVLGAAHDRLHPGVVRPRLGP
jgi:hypothetical protein